MTARLLRPGALITLCVLLVCPALVSAQGGPQRFGPLSVVIPPRWVTQGNSGSVRFFSPDSTPQQFFAVEFFPPETTPQSVREHHALILSRFGNLGQTAGLPQNGTLGPFIWTRIEFQRPLGQTETVVLYSVKVESVYIAVVVDSNRADLASRNLPIVTEMLGRSVLGSGITSLPSSASSTPLPSGAPASLAEYVYTVPPNWTTDRYPDGTVLSSPISSTGEKCLLTIMPLRGAGSSLQSDASSVFQEAFKTYELRDRTTDGLTLPATLIRGTSGQGWDYFILKRGIGKPRDARGTYDTLLGFAFVAKLGNNVAAIYGMSKVPLISSCFGELQANAWPQFFYDLNFKSWSSADPTAAMKQKLAGTWTIATGSVADRFVFNAEGRYDSAAAVQNYSALNSSEVLETTRAFFGNGGYSLKGNTITLTPDNKQTPPENGFLRLEEESTDNGRTWVPHLYLMRHSRVDGKDYEVRYNRSPQ